MRFRHLSIRLQTTDGPYGVELDFPDGLVLVWADNSMGKSTCFKSMLVALGLEAMLSPQQASLPLPYVMTDRLESISGDHKIIESNIFLEIENKKKQRVTLHRTVKGARDKNLITVYDGPILTSPDQTCLSKDFFVNRSGAATRENGFHYWLARYLGWNLPNVPTFDGQEYPLYIQCIFPYLMVEQTRGWSTVQSLLPTQFRIKDLHKRVVEFLLNLDAQKIAFERQIVQNEKIQLEGEWTSVIQKIDTLASKSNARARGFPIKPTVEWPLPGKPDLVCPYGDAWVSISERRRLNAETLKALEESGVKSVGEEIEKIKKQLSQNESKLFDVQALVSRLHAELKTEELEAKRIELRLVDIEEDIQKNKDVKTLRSLGSRISSEVDSNHCPLCHQNMQDALVDMNNGQSVMSLDETVSFLEEQRRTYTAVLAASHERIEGRKIQVQHHKIQLGELRDDIRVLRKSIISDDRIPSIQAIRQLYEIENSIKSDQAAETDFDGFLEKISTLSSRWSDILKRQAELPKGDMSISDLDKISKWTHSLQEQLKQYGFLSFQSNLAHVSQDSYRAEHDGFDIESSMPIQNSISASDLIRTIWSYLGGMLEISRTENTNHPGMIVFDEPRQQSARDSSFSELLKRVSTSINYGQQVLLFTSENRNRLKQHADGIPHCLIEIEGRVLSKR